MQLFGQIFYERAVKKQIEARQQYAMWQYAVQNFTEYHGYPPHAKMNVTSIRDDYSRPWRKTPIPKAGTPKLHG